MTTLTAFNEMMGQFLGDLTDTFPENATVKAAFVAPRNRETFDAFMKDIQPWTNQLMAKNPSFFCDENEFAKNLDLNSIWSEASDASKAAIWQYLQTMYMIGTTLSMFPPETLAMIESAAEKCAKNMQNSGGAMNEEALMAGMNTMLTQMMGGGSGNPLAALLGGQQPVPRKPSRNKSKKISK
jgi:hypothetical protein